MQTDQRANSNFSQKVRRLLEFSRGISAPPDHSLTSWLFLRALGLIYLFAFISLGTQILGLIGSHGILPVSSYLAAAQNNLGDRAFWQLPGLLWLNSSDAFLTFLCWAGVGLSLLVIFDVLTLPALVALWTLYLSFLYAGQDFMLFQWDILLLEVGFLAIFLAPFHILPKITNAARPTRVMIWLFRLLLFRLILESGIVKLTSGDQTWRDFTATTYHYWTQPLPTLLAWYMNQLPFAFHQVEVLFTFFVELIAPFLLLGPRRIRIAGAFIIAAHQTLILLTGNYTFFNLLTISLCFLQLDDSVLARFFPARLMNRIGSSAKPVWIIRPLLVSLLALLIAYLNFVQLSDQLLPGRLTFSVSSYAYRLEPLRLVNGYGLFAVMTTTRPEIIIEGSTDGQNWKPYEFKYKPGDLARPPTWAEPFQPRLDWQMWFMALEGSPYAEGWFLKFVRRLLEGSPDVLALLDKNPFPESPPRYIRALLYDYHFTDADQRQRTGNWWQREQTGVFLRPYTLDDFQ